MTTLNNLWGTNPTAVAAPSAADVVAGTTLAAFQGWPVAAQTSFVGQYGTGNPPQVVLGAGAGQTLLTMTPLGGVVAEPLPAAFSVAPSAMDYATFASWSPDVQCAYIQANKPGGSDIELGSGGSSFGAKRMEPHVAYQNGTTSPALATDVQVTTSSAMDAVLDSTLPTVTPVAPGSAESGVPLTASAFFALPQHQQEELASRCSTLRVSGATATDPVMALTLDDGRTIDIRVPSSAYPGFSTPLTSSTSPVDGDAFKTWPPEVQKAYLLAAASGSVTTGASLTPGGTADPPVAIVFASGSGGNGVTATLMSKARGSAVTLTPNPAGFADMLSGTAVPSTDVFLSWSPGLQLAYTLAHTTPSQTSCTVGTITVTRSSSNADGLAYTAPSLTETYSYDSGGAGGDDTTLIGQRDLAPFNIDPDVFGLKPASSQLSYLQNLTGAQAFATSTNQSAAIIGAAGNQAIIAGPASGSGAVTTYAIPTSFNTSPQSILSSTFLSWPTAVQALYIGKNKVTGSLAPNGQVTFADGMIYGFGTNNAIASVPTLDISSAAGQAEVAIAAATVYTAASSTPSPSSASPSNLSPTTFELWTTEQQRAYIKAQSPSGPTTIGSGSTAIDVFIGAGDTAASPAKVYIVQNLQKTDIAKMSFADQVSLTKAAGYPALAAAYNLIPNATTPLTSTSAGTPDALTTIQTFINNYRTQVTSSAVPAYVQSLFTAQIDLISSQLFGTGLPAAPVAGTTTSVPTAPTTPTSIAGQTTGSAIFSETDLKTQLDAIQTRFNRVSAFAAEATQKNFVIKFDYSTQSNPTTFQSYVYSPTDDNQHPHLGPTNLFQFLESAVYPKPSLPQPDACGVYAPGVTGATGNAAYTVQGTAANTITLGGSEVNLYQVKNVTVYNATLSFANSNGNPPLPTSIDSDATIRSGYEKFVAQESAIMANKMLAANLARTGTVAGSNQSLDLPKLLCLYMMYNNNIQNAVVSADSEEVNQTNAVLQEYASMQQIINATTATSTNDANAKLNLQYGNANTEIQRLFVPGQYGVSPIEKMYFGSSNWDRPRKGLYVDPSGDTSKNTSDTASNWTQFGQQLTDVVTQINQQSQIKMNEVNSETKQQDRYFELASTALSKLSDTLSQIASAT